MKVSAIVMSLCLCAAAQAQTCFNPVPEEFVDFTRFGLGQQEIVTGRMFDHTDYEHVEMTVTLEGNDCSDIVACQSFYDAGSQHVSEVWSGDRCVSAAPGFYEHPIFPDWDTWWMRLDFTEDVNSFYVQVQTLSDLPLYEDTTCGTIACDNPSIMMVCYNLSGDLVIDWGGTDFMPQHASVPGLMTPDDRLTIGMYDQSQYSRIRWCDLWGDRAELVLGLVRVIVFRHIHAGYVPPNNDPLFCSTNDGWPCGWLPSSQAQ